MRWRGVGLSVVLTLAACGGDDDPVGPGPDEFTFRLDVTGALNEVATGPAFFGSDTDPEVGPIWVLLLGEEAGRHVVVAGRPGATRPAVGTYALGDGSEPTTDWTLAHIVADGEELVEMFLADSGAVTVTTSSDTMVRGSLAFRALGQFGETSDTVRVTGTFTASPAQTLSAGSGLAGPVGTSRRPAIRGILP